MSDAHETIGELRQMVERFVAERRDQVADELADVLCYALALANSLGIEVGDAMRKKMVKNAQKYPADEYRGRWGAADRRPPTQ